MTISFIGQGLNEIGESVGSMLLDSFADPEFDKFDCFVAFASEPGIDDVSEAIRGAKQRFKHFQIVLGVDQKGTSKEALQALLKLDVDASIYYTVSRPIYHPKIYLFDGPKKCRIIIGSSNLTEYGLFKNVEASVVLDVSKPDAEGEALINQVHEYYKPFFGGDNGNIRKLTQQLIDYLYEVGMVPDESDRVRAQEEKVVRSRIPASDDKPGIANLFPAVRTQKLPKGVSKRIRPKQATLQPEAIQPEVSEGITVDYLPESMFGIEPEITEGASTTVVDWNNKGPLLWRKLNLPGSDVNIGGPTTNATGGLRLTQARFTVGGSTIDQTRYFRQSVFGNAVWIIDDKPKPYVEVADVLFNVRILGDDKGQHRLRLRHKPSGEAHQGNYTTLISWGKLGDEIKKIDLRGKDLYLYAPTAGYTEPFFIEIV